MKNALNLSGQHGIFDPRSAKPVTLIGIGSVGSNLAVALAKIGVTDLTVYDADVVESHNIPSSAFRSCDVGKLKVRALAQIVEQASGLKIKTVPRMYQGEDLKDTVVSCVDTMEARMEIWKHVKGNPLVDIFVDTRVADKLVSVFAVNWNKEGQGDYYEHHLYPTKKTVPTFCGVHGFLPVSWLAASIAACSLTNAWTTGNTSLHVMFLAESMETIVGNG